ncbi:MAG TPA: hypothetical protein PLV42_13050 [bacterium]|nr:hypothetical protein [bacterium]
MVTIRHVSIVLLALTLLGACATSKKQYKNMESHLRDGRYDVAIAQIERAKENGDYSEKDRVLYYLDLGLLRHFAGDWGHSNELLTAADEAMEDLFTKSVSRMIGSAVINDTLTEYAGEDYEFVFVNVFKALNYINLGDVPGAVVEVRRINDKLKLLGDKYEKLAADSKRPPLKFASSTLARFLSLVLFRLEREYDSAEVDMRLLIKTVEEQSAIYSFLAASDIGALAPPSQPAAGTGRLSVVAFSGLSPEKIAKRLNLVILPNSIVIEYDKGDERYRDMFGFAVLPLPCFGDSCPAQTYWFKFEFPELVTKSHLAADRVAVWVDGTEYPLVFLEDLERIARVTFENDRNATIAKTITRAVVKYVAVVVAAEVTKKKVGGQGGQLAGLLLGLGGSIAASASENADLRMSFFFPAKAFVADIALVPGEHVVTVRYYKGGVVIGEQTKKVTVAEGSGAILESFNF